MRVIGGIRENFNGFRARYDLRQPDAGRPVPTAAYIICRRPAIRGAESFQARNYPMDWTRHYACYGVFFSEAEPPIARKHRSFF